MNGRCDADVILVGGGLANGLIAWRLSAIRPELKLLLIEASSRLGGQHTWSFHHSDLTPRQHEWIEPLVAHSWRAYDVAFAGYKRRIESGYASITAQHFHHQVSGRLGDAVLLEARVTSVARDCVTLVSGERLTAAAVIDGRGFSRSPHLALAYQKFLGQEVLCERSHDLAFPIVMDASVSQVDGYRFVYVLPLSAHRLLIEDTYYAGSPSLHHDTIRRRIASYAAARGWPVTHVIREEHGVLPITLAGAPDDFWRDAHEVPRSGLAAGLFHPTTGYALPDAVRLADLIAGLPSLSASALFAMIRDYAMDTWRRQAFFRKLNRLLFLAALPPDRHEILQRFYQLPAPVIARFYAGRPSWADKLRIMAGRPPVPLYRAILALAKDVRRRDIP